MGVEQRGHGGFSATGRLPLIVVLDMRGLACRQNNVDRHFKVSRARSLGNGQH
ncbi:hypothetical protein D3C86_2170450 [compost metagenome]